MRPSQPGPRDWTPPPPPPTHPPQHGYAYAASVRRSTTRGAGLGSFLFGAVAAAMIFAQPGNITAGNGFLFSTVGLTGIALGFTALRNRQNARISSSIMPTLGILLGATGTLVMVLHLVNFYQHPAATAVTQPISVAAPATVQPRTIQPAPVQPAPAVAVTREQDRMNLAQSEGTIVFLLKQARSQDGNFPTLLNASSGGFIVTPAGNVKLPDGAHMIYVPRDNNHSFALTMVGVTGAVAVFDTNTGVINTQ